MIKSFRHKGLEAYFYDGDKRKIRTEQAQKISDILDRLDASTAITDINYPGSGLHSLKGKMMGKWAVKVSGNWRIVFAFENGHAFDVDYVDYH